MNLAENPRWQEDAQAPPPVPPISPAPALPAAAPVAGDGLGPKNPSLAAFLGLFPGIGHVYDGLYLRGLTFFLIIASLIKLTDRYELFGFAIAFFWLFNVIDAYRQAVLINYGYAQDLGLIDRPRHPKAAQGGLATGIILLAIGLFALLDQWFVFDLDWLFDLWPVALMAIGAWLVWGSVRERRKARPEDAPGL